MFGRHRLSVAMLAAAALLLESTLIRLLAIAQFYHFAFLVVSLALLGFGASGTWLSVSDRLRKTPLHKLLTFVGVGFTVSVGIAYSILNFLPFDSYSIAWDRWQILYFFLYYLALTLPFLMSGLGVGAAIMYFEEKSHLVYAANLIGSGVGALLAPVSLWLAGVSGSLLLSALLGLAAVLPLGYRSEGPIIREKPPRKVLHFILSFFILGGIAVIAILAGLNLLAHAPLGLTISPYKGLSQVRRYSDTQIIYRRWNAISRIDVVANAGVHQYPGLSYLYKGDLPIQIGLSVDADSLLPITLSQPDEFKAAAFLPESIVFDLRPQANVLVLDPGAGLGVLQALAGTASRITTVVENPLIYLAVSKTVPGFNVFDDPRVKKVSETGRIFLASESSRYDVIFLPLTDAFRPVSSGAYSLGEDYSLTVESLKSFLDRLTPGGVLVLSRWLQSPPSESLRLAATLIEALEQAGFDPREALILYRGIQTMTFIVKPSGWGAVELQKVRAFAEERKYDLVWMSNIQDGEVNRFNRLPEPIYYRDVLSLLTASDQKPYADISRFDIHPPTDDHPFFFHFFTWNQTPEVLATFGHTWQPFGGSGYLVMVALLIFVSMLSLFLIVFPLAHKIQRSGKIISFGLQSKTLAYFSFLGFGYLFIEIPLIQRWILVFGHPIYAFTVIVFTLLLFSSIGSAIARRIWIPKKLVLVLIVILSFLLALFLPKLTNLILGWPLFIRVLAAILILGPIAVLMGIPYPIGLMMLEEYSAELIPWAWAVNGCASVIASICAAMLALSYGFTVALMLGCALYAGVLVIYWLFPRSAKVVDVPQ